MSICLRTKAMEKRVNNRRCRLQFHPYFLYDATLSFILSGHAMFGLQKKKKRSEHKHNDNGTTH